MKTKRRVHTSMKKISDYNNKKLTECFDCSKMNNTPDISESNVELNDVSGSVMLSVMLEKGKYLSYFGTRFARVDQNQVIHVFKDFM